MGSKKAEQLTDIVLAIFQLNGVLADWGDNFVSADGLTSAKWQMLGAVALSDHPLTAPQVGMAMGVTRQGAQKQLNVLVSEGLLETRPNPMHKRSSHYYLTQVGRAKYEAIEKRWNSHAQRVSSSFSSSDLAVAESLLRKMTRIYADPSVHHEAKA
ncbi:MarR family winged helix-turn-helix transcriptional regulator [Xanthomonas tesorieronis]|uniref:MarR family winged helix-turn-helix transcriptional regulator n=1 Tax=Xanthomonas tesorieronis TaxID=3160839 RepID=UPI0035178D89